jgi:WD40 repeat protein
LCAAAGVAFGHDDDEPLGPFGPWSEPVNLGPVVNSSFDDTHPAISKNGLSLFITSSRPGGVNGTTNLGQFQEIWVSHKKCSAGTFQCGSVCCDASGDVACVKGVCCVPPHCPR